MTVPCGFSVKPQTLVDLEKVKVRADLYRAVCGARDRNLDRRAAFVQADGAALGQHLTRNERLFCRNRIVYGHELCAVRKSRLDLNFVNHLGNAVHHVVSGEQLSACLHELGHRSAVARHFRDLARDVRDGFRIIQPYAARAALLCQISGQMQQQLIGLAWSQSHDFRSFLSGRSLCRACQSSAGQHGERKYGCAADQACRAHKKRLRIFLLMKSDTRSDYCAAYCGRDQCACDMHK